MADYASQADFEGYVLGWVTDDPAALERILQNAERDVDTVFGPMELADNGLKYGHPHDANEKGLTPGQVVALTNATCAQAEYRIQMGEDFFVQDQYETVSGPNFSRTGRLARIGPKTMAELQAADLVRTMRITSAP
jgi:hypothetical protein